MLESRLESTTTMRLLKKSIRHPLRAVNRLVQAASFARFSEWQERDVLL